MNVYEAFGLLLVIGVVVMLLVAAHALGEPERVARRADHERERENSGS